MQEAEGSDHERRIEQWRRYQLIAELHGEKCQRNSRRWRESGKLLYEELELSGKLLRAWHISWHHMLVQTQSALHLPCPTVHKPY